MTFTVLILMSFLGALLTAIVGMGGGMMLIAIMPGIVPTAAIIPLHGAIQFASNISRVIIDIRSLNGKIVAQWFIGTCVGATLAAPLVRNFPLDYLPLLLGVFILLFTWTPKERFFYRIPCQYFGLGLITAFLSLFVGATGPMGLTAIIREKMSTNTLIATSSAMNASVQGAKVGAFLAIGFSFVPYLDLLISVIVAVTVGSLVGKVIRSRLPAERLLLAVKILLSLLAVRMIITSLM